jgi:hypothetical protein
MTGLGNDVVEGGVRFEKNYPYASAGRSRMDPDPDEGQY